MWKPLLKTIRLLLVLAVMFRPAQAQAPANFDPGRKMLEDKMRKQLGEKGFQEWLKATGRDKLPAMAPPAVPLKLSPDEEALFAAIQKSDIEQVSVLLARGVNVKIQDKGGDTPLGRAAAYQLDKIFDLFLSKGADINDMDVMGTPLWWATKRGDLKRVEWLLEHGADLNKSQKTSPTAIATINGHPEVAKYLIAKGAKTDVFTAAQQGDHKQLAALLQQNPALALEKATSGINAALSPLHLATEADSTEGVELLLANGADMWIKREDGMSPVDLIPSAPILKLFLAKKSFLKSLASARLLTRFLAQGRDEPAQHLLSLGELPANTPNLLVNLDLEKDRQLLKQLLDNGAMKSDGGRALYQTIPTSGRVGATSEALQFRALWLIEQGCPLEALFPVGSFGEQTSVLNEAIRWDELVIAKALIDKGVNLAPQWKRENYGGGQSALVPTGREPPLLVAAKWGRLEIAKLLVERGVDVNASEPKSGFTPLHIAANNNHREVVEFLLSKEANPNAKAIPGGTLIEKTPAQLAAANGHTEIVKLLQTKE